MRGCVIFEKIEPAFDGWRFLLSEVVHGSTESKNIEGADPSPAVNQHEAHRPDPD
jgi:hypothetical protein